MTVTGSKKDMRYYSDINMWSLHGEALTVAEDNEHLGLIVSGLDEEIKNADKNIDSARKILFDMLGNIFSFRCKLSQTVLSHVWSIYISPVLRSGLSALPIRPPIMKTLTSFYHKILRGILKFSPVSPIAPLSFLLGQLPYEAYVHMDILSLFWIIWANPQTKIFDIVKYLLMMSDSTSLTWSAHLRLLCQLYSLPDPLLLMYNQPWPKERWKVLVKAKIVSYHESAWREKAMTNSKLTYLNVQVNGLSGRPHPVLSGILTTQEVTKSRVHLKMLAGDYPCQMYLSSDNASCLLCQSLLQGQPTPTEDMVHLLTRCRATADTRSGLIPDLLNTISQYLPTNSILANPNQVHLTQFILDPTSLNLPMNIRLSPDHPALTTVLTSCRNVCFAVHKDRTRKLKQLKASVKPATALQ